MLMTIETVQIPASTAKSTDLAYASQWRLMWLRFKRHRLAMVGLLIVTIFYVVALLAEFLAPFSPERVNSRFVYHPPQQLQLVDVADDGSWALRPHVLASKLARDPATLKAIYVPDEARKIYLNFWVQGDAYRLWGLFPTDRHFFGPENAKDMAFLLGSDRLGRDMLSRVIYGARFTLSLGLAGVAISMLLGIVLGGISGYRGGKTDWFIQRVIEYILSLPTIPIWLALAAALPRDWPSHYQYLAITVIISLIGWTELARVVRGRFLAMRNEVFVKAAKLDGASEARIIFRHMLPSMISHVIASVTLAIPMMILAETSLSFLGLGLQPPAISWGVLLKEVQNVRSIAQAPWLFLPGVCVVLTVLALNFMGDGLRDAADPYSV